jgi:hypothetical protein
MHKALKWNPLEGRATKRQGYMGKAIAADEFDRIFDDGDEDILQYCDMSTLRRPGLEQSDVNLSLPDWMIRALDSEAERLSVTRQAVIRLWLNERLKPNRDETFEFSINASQ